MPAIQPERLKQQTARLSEHFSDPPAFVRGMHDLLDFYADRAHRAGQAARPGPLIPAYNVRPPVLRTLLQAIMPQADRDVNAALELCDALWAEPFLEFRRLAAMLLGRLSPTPPEPILNRLQTWITTGLELHLTEVLLSTGVERLHREQPAALLQWIQNHLESTQSFDLQLGLRALLPLIRNRAFENVPVFFRLVQPLSLKTPGAIRPDLLDVIHALAERSPSETAYFLRQSLAHPDAQDTPWLIRQSLAKLPPEMQDGLRSAVRETDRHPSAFSRRS